jgi:hypothetical protein
MRWFVLPLALLTAGCFSSREPLFEPAQGTCPFATPTALAEVERDGSVQGRFTFETAGAFCKTTDPQGKVSRSLFVPIGASWWIVQDDATAPTYVLMHRSGRKYLQYLPRCRDFSKARLTRLGVEFDEDREKCIATEARQIETLFRGWRNPFRSPSGAFEIAEPATRSEEPSRSAPEATP